MVIGNLVTFYSPVLMTQPNSKLPGAAGFSGMEMAIIVSFWAKEATGGLLGHVSPYPCKAMAPTMGLLESVTATFLVQI